MKRAFTVENDSHEYTVTECTAIAVTAGDTERQDALYVYSFSDAGEKFEYVVFGYAMPEDDDEFLTMSDDYSAWSSDYEDVETVDCPRCTIYDWVQ